MPRPFVYAPGLPGYGTRGVDGSAGLTGIATYFSAYDGNSDSVTIKSKIIANKELFSNDELIPGYPTRTYQDGDIFIDKNARIFQIDFDEANLYIDTGIFLNTSGFFSSGPAQISSPEFERYSNSYDTQKYLIDIVYSNTVADYTTFPVSIYDNAPVYYAQVKYVDQLLAPNFNNVYPFQVWTIGNSIDDNAIALVREQDTNLWRFGNYDGGSVRDVSLSLDFGDIYSSGNLSVNNNLLVTADISMGGDLSIFGDIQFTTGPFGLNYIRGNAVGVLSQANLLFQSEDSTTNPGNVFLIGGDATGSGTFGGGEVTIETGYGSSSNGNAGAGGDLDINVGSGGDAVVTGSSNGTGGKGGLINSLAGGGGDATGVSGNITGGNGGSYSLIAGDGGDGLAGTTSGGGGGFGGGGGDVSIMGGQGGYAEGWSENEGGDGGDIWIVGGTNGVSDDDLDGNSGRVYIRGGKHNYGNGGGATGRVYIDGGDPGGLVYINSLVGGGTFVGGDLYVTGSGDQIRIADGTLTDPAIIFSANTDVGFYRPDLDRIGFALGNLNGRKAFEMTNGGDGAYIVSVDCSTVIQPRNVTTHVNGLGIEIITRAAGGRSGKLSLLTANSTNGTDGGDIEIKAGNGSSTAFTSGGDILIQSGNGGTTSGVGGSIDIVVGDGSTAEGSLRVSGLIQQSSNTTYHLGATGNGGQVRWTSSTPSSDAKLKDLKGAISGKIVLDSIKEMQAYYYNLNEYSKEVFKGDDSVERIQIGLIAQDVEKYFPEVVIKYVGDNGDEYRTLDYDRISALLVEGMKEQQNQIEDLKDIVNKQQDQINKLLELNNLK